MNIKKHWDVIVVGGGIIGLSIAYRLAQQKVKVLLLDRQEPGHEASSAAAGMLAPYTEAEEDTPLLRLAIQSREIYPDFVREIEAETGLSAHYNDAGALFLALEEHEAKTLEARCAWQKKMGFAVERLTTKELLATESALSPEVRMGLFYPGDHQLDNRALLAALLKAIRNRGVEVRSGMNVHRCLREGSRITGVEVSGEKFSARTTVLAAGCWSPEIETGTNEPLPIYPTRGQIIAVRCGQTATRRGGLRHTLRYEGGYVAVFPETRLLLGGTMEDVGYSKINTLEAMQRMSARAASFVPVLAASEFVEAWSGLRPNTRDHLPVLGKSSDDGLIYATGHFRNGILLTPITARIIAELIITGHTSTDLHPFSIRRFQGK